MRVARTTAVLFTLAAGAAAFQPPAHHAEGSPGKPAAKLEVKGDPASTEVLAGEWVPAPWVRGEGKDGKIRRGPFRCSACEEAGEYEENASLPPRALQLAKRPVADLETWWRKEHKLKPVTIAAAHAVLMLDLPPCSSKPLDTAERTWLEGHMGKLKDALTPHQRAHLYAFRYLRMEARFLDLFCLDRDQRHFIAPFPAQHLGAKGRSEVHLFPQEKAYQEFGRHFFGGCGRWTSFWFHEEVEACVAAFNGEGVSDPVLAARFDHQIAHHLLYQYRSFYNFLPVWFPEGLGHWFEKRHAVHENTICVLGLLKEYVYADNDWWKAAKDLVNLNEDLPLAQLAMQEKQHELKPKWHPQAWSLVNFMIGLGKDKFRRFLDVLKTKGDSESMVELQYRAIETAYGTDLVSFQKAWRNWVLATKPARR